MLPTDSYSYSYCKLLNGVVGPSASAHWPVLLLPLPLQLQEILSVLFHCNKKGSWAGEIYCAIFYKAIIVGLD